MAETNRSTEALRERLTNMLADWGAEMSAVLTELDQAHTRAEALEASWRQLDASWTEGGDAPCDSAAIVAMATEGWVAGVDVLTAAARRRIH